MKKNSQEFHPLHTVFQSPSQALHASEAIGFLELQFQEI